MKKQFGQFQTPVFKAPNCSFYKEKLQFARLHFLFWFRKQRY